MNLLPSINLTTALLVAMLVIAIGVDLRQQRIPNLLTLGGAAMGLCLQLGTGGIQGLLAGLGGLGVGLLMLLPLYATGGTGAGDVKLMAAAGSFLSPMNALLAACLSVIAGGMIAMMILVAEKSAGAFLSRYWLMLKCFLTTGRVSYVPPSPVDPAAGRFSYAAAIATGTLATLLWRSP